MSLGTAVQELRRPVAASVLHAAGTSGPEGGGRGDEGAPAPAHNILPAALVRRAVCARREVASSQGNGVCRARGTPTPHEKS
jgi:hypothetical protein